SAKKSGAKKSGAKKSGAKKGGAKASSAKKGPSKVGVLAGAKAKAYDEILAAFVGKKGIERRPMFGADMLAVGGKGFTMVFKGAFVVKLGPERVDALVAAGAGVPFDPG